MRGWLANDTIRVALVLIALAAARVAQLAGWTSTGAPSQLDSALSTMSSRDLNKEAREALTAGYYEGLLNEASRVSGMTGLLNGGKSVDRDILARADRHERRDFLYFDLLPNTEIPDYRDDRHKYMLRTNSLGMRDREYSIEKAAGTRRIALLGDSITYGQGAPDAGNFESLLERRLNERHLAGHVSAFEILNFAVGGYAITQMLDVAVEKVPAFSPDVYIVTLSELSVFRNWGHHITSLVYEGIDLKYDYLRRVAREAALAREDDVGTSAAKLAKFRIPTVRWALGQIRDQANRDHASLLVVFVPTVDDPRFVAEEFLGVRQMVQELGIPAIDVLDTFANVPDRGQLWVAERDRHPNAEGHRLLFERIYEQVITRDEIRNIVLGVPGAR